DDGQCNVPAGKQFIAISAGRYHSLALKAPVVSYEPYETDLVVTSPDSGMTLEVVRGGINGVPPATQGDYVLKMDWTGETGGKVELKHNCLNFDLAGEDLLLVDVYTRTHGLYIEDSFSAIWDDAFGWHTTDTPTDNEWGTVEFDVSSCNQTGLVEITALMFESLGLDYGTIYIDNIRLGYNEAALDSPENVTATGYDSRIDLTWGIVTQPELQGYNIYRSTSVDGTFTKINDSLHPAVASVYSDFFGTNGQTYYYYVKAVNKAEVESAASATVSAASYVMEPNEILTTVQEATFRYFWDYGHPVSGLAREGYECGHGSDVVTTGGTGMGLMAICVGAERGFVTRAEAAERTLKILTFLNDEEKAPRFHGAWPHWLNGATGGLVLFGKQDGCDIPETSFLIQGMLTARKYFDDMNDATEADINDIATELWEDVEWDWFLRRSDAGYENSETLYWLWSPTVGFNLGEDPNNPLKVRGYNECMIAYILAIASPTHPIPASCYYSGWASSDDYINGGTLYTHKQWAGIDYGGNLFWTHYSYLGLDPDWSDAYCNYFDNNRNISLIQHAYAVDNPGNYDGYSNLVWGFTACSSPPDCSYNHSIPGEDDGTIGPTAALSAMIYTPSESIATLEHFYDYNTYGDNMWGAFGFVDGFNLSKDPDWFAPGYLAIDQGPIVVMMENHRTGLCWNKFMANTEINDALDDIAAVTVMFDDFDGDNINDAWYGNGGTWPTIDNTNSEQLYNGSYALKVTYDKDDETWVYVSSPVSVGSKDFSDFKKLGTLVYSDRAVNYTAKIEYSGGSVEQEFSVPANAWTNIVLDFSAQSSQMTNVNRVLYFPDTGAYDTSGTFWLDNIVLW
ncbi:MAG: hypothetical protein KAI59_02360, partial [Planctomycetes bacterium]|nr:hypothetical protein [Planctomycetota bacterium]